MTADTGPNLVVGNDDPGLSKQLEDALTAFNEAATGTAYGDSFTVKVTDKDGALVGGLTASTWGEEPTLKVKEHDRRA
ncbi:hypothetical protein F5972_13555 [Microbispora cellulosiformans]|uniref:Uncharacterized protein n=1 Tax=Microbispora cellulosiformans TaxID=2614688 RepID=A0A5J5K452_9ACTN|nr:hypothetical protein [Microbispora cellulosiformans]KAA9379203.1 hypothetical protein F5972_13555 [Microbispora cellulosiformans]